MKIRENGGKNYCWPPDQRLWKR